MDEKIKQYIDKQKSTQKEIILALRKIFCETLKNYEEKFGWGVIVLSNGKFYIAAMKNKVHVGFSIVGLDKKDINVLEGSGKTMRHIKISDLKNIDEPKLKKLIKLVNKKAKCVEC
ncbi:MAG TPA: DUF1801 domain-containing protein [Candidatus Pacearchaeota archaeon]|nr:DUF1801 domain-containing protein [Candidatus Pacearchaeota archaeon]HQM24793.1 DUF1801 domain-containing protein [Candidatus Pacearchaeota archaeon]